MIPLRPLGVGEILDGSFASVRRNPKATLGLAAMLMTISAVISATITQAALHASGLSLPSSGQPQTSAQAGHLLGQLLTTLLPALALSLFLSFLVQVILAGLLAPVVVAGVQGERISAAEAWRAARPRLGSLLAATVLVLLVGLSPTVLLGLLLLLAVALSAPLGVYLAIGIPGFFVAVLLTVWMVTRLSLVTPVVVVEGAGPVRALGRSWRLVRRSFWRVFGILLLAGIIVTVAAGILQVPFSVVGTISAHGGGTHLAATIISVIGTILAGTVTRPIAVGVTVLLYVDMRMRKEGLDLALRTGTGDFAAAWRPPADGAPLTPGFPVPGAPPPAPGAPPPVPGASPPAPGAPPPW